MTYQWNFRDGHADKEPVDGDPQDGMEAALGILPSGPTCKMSRMGPDGSHTDKGRPC